MGHRSLKAFDPKPASMGQTNLLSLRSMKSSFRQGVHNATQIDVFSGRVVGAGGGAATNWNLHQLLY
jgi:hypothetical protein